MGNTISTPSTPRSPLISVAGSPSQSTPSRTASPDRLSSNRSQNRVRSNSAPASMLSAPFLEIGQELPPPALSTHGFNIRSKKSSYVDWKSVAKSESDAITKKVNEFLRAAGIAEANGDYEAAAIRYQKAIEVASYKPDFKSNQSVLDHVLGQVYVFQGSFFRNQDMVNQALESYQKGAKLTRKFALSAFDLLLSLRRFEDAEADLRGFESLYGVCVESRSDGIRLLAARGNLEEALVEVNLLKSNNERLDLLYVDSALYNLKLGRVAQALIDINIALQHDPNNSDAQSLATEINSRL